MNEELLIDIKNLPIDILKLWPPFLKDKLEMQEIAKVARAELLELQSKTDEDYRNMFILTANEKGLARYEKLYNIVPRDDSTLEDRRFEVLTKRQTRMPYTKRALTQLLDTLVGPNQYTLDVSYAERRVKVAVELKRKNQVNAIADLLRHVIPANMLFAIKVRYNQYYMLSKFTYAELKQYTYKQLKDDVQIKETYIDRGGVII